MSTNYTDSNIFMSNKSIVTNLKQKHNFNRRIDISAVFTKYLLLEMNHLEGTSSMQ